ncbi:SDR family NAD(P)-dependent oxidoreductase [Lentzea sp. NPDC060358]|uniref:SDR family NAD(P)-dependent oxidoreductase n=1 Tax=Lentzea sp. NPDC060358 TaxID=3347103 RepID=UPI0036621BE3
MDFANKKALVTGAGALGGLGHAIAKIFASGGAEVVIVGRDPERGAEVVADVGGNTRFVQANLVERAYAQRLVDVVGTVDILVNNAAVIPMGATADQELDTYEEAFAVNVRAPFILIAGLVPKMAANGGGSVVNVSSTASSIGIPGMAVYGATKAAVESLTRSWAAEFASSNVRVNAVLPGPMHTSMMISSLGPDAGGFGNTVPLNRTAHPAEIAEVVAFAASDRASYVTGAVIAADGGRTAI